MSDSVELGGVDDRPVVPTGEIAFGRAVATRDATSDTAGGLVEELGVVSARVRWRRSVRWMWRLVLGGGVALWLVVVGVLWRRRGGLLMRRSRAAVERYRLERFKARRLVRVGLVLRDSVRPREWVRLPGRLRGALVRGVPVAAPDPVDYRSVLVSLTGAGDVFGVGSEPDYPYLRVAHWGPGASFGSVAPHRVLASAGDVDEVLEAGCDVVVVEPVRGVGVPGFVTDGVGRFVDAGFPVGGVCAVGG